MNSLHFTLDLDDAWRRIYDEHLIDGILGDFDDLRQALKAGIRYYGISLLHCTPVSLAAGGPGLGAVWGEETARKMLAEAGFKQVDVIGTPRPQNYMFVCTR